MNNEGEQDNNLHIIPDPNDGTMVLVIFHGKAILRLSPDFAKAFARLLTHTASRCEAYINPHKIIIQDAMLIRSGAPFALTDGKLREEALKEAQWGTEARKGMPMDTNVRQEGAQSAARTGLPSVHKVRTH